MTVAAAVLALATAGIAGVGSGGIPAATADPACSAAWPAEPAAFAALTVGGGALCWTADVLGPDAYSAVVAVVGDSALTTNAGGDSSSSTLVVRDLATGAPRWSAPIASTFSFPDALTGTDGLVVLPAEVPTAAVARDVVTGVERWRLAPVAPTGQPLHVDTIVDAGATVYLLATANRADFETSIQETIAVTRATGAVRWRRPVRVIGASDGAVVAILPSNGSYPPPIGALDPTTGELRRDLSAVGVGARFFPGESDVELVGETLIGRIFDGTHNVVVAVDTVTGAPRWKREAPMSVGMWFHVVGDAVLFAQSQWETPRLSVGVLQALDPVTGAVRWERAEPASSILGAGNGVVALGPPYQLASTPLDPEAGQVRLIDATSGAMLRTLGRGPWRVRPMRAAIGNGVVVLVRQYADIPMGPPLRGAVARFCDGVAPSPRLEQGLQALPPPTAAAYVPIAPIRLFDSRDAGWGGFQCPGERLTVTVTGQAGIPAGGVTAVALNLTVDATGDAGFVTAWPAGEAQPTASALNVTGPGQTRSNVVILPVAPDGKVSIVTQSGGHLLADVAGYFVASQSATAGRIVSVAPQRLLDSRVDPGEPLGPRRPVTLPVAGASGSPVPAGAVAVLATLTATESAGAGYVTAWPGGTERPLVSNVNLDGAHQTIANFALVPLGTGGAIELFASTSLHLVVDVVGYVTGPGAPAATAGLLVPVLPSRVFDTRLDVGVLPAGWSVAPRHAGVGPVPADAAAVFVNVTGVGATEVSHVRIWPTGATLPLVSSLNLAPGDSRAAATLMQVGDGGRISYWNSAGTVALAADVMAYVLG